MEQTQSLKEHLAAIQNELKTATQKQDADARARINVALEHAQKAASELKAQAAASSGDAKKQADETMHHLDELAKNGEKALSESGDALHARVDTMIAHAKSAVEASKRA